MWPVELDATVDQLVTDFGKSRNEVARQAARTDSAALRVEERSEFVALNVSRYYFDYLLQQRILAATIQGMRIVCASIRVGPSPARARSTERRVTS